STVASRFAPTVAPLVALVGLIVLIVGIIAVLRGRRRTGAAATVLGAVGAAANLAVIIVLVGAVTSAGGSVNMFAATFGPSAIDKAKPDRQEVYEQTSSGDALAVSVYEPDGAEGAAPTTMYVHGGGWIAGEANASSSELR